MSASRQQFTGGMWSFLIGGWLLLFSVFLSGYSLWFLHQQHVIVESINPWMLTVSDLTWQRLVWVILSKPGAILLIIGGLALMWTLIVIGISGIGVLLSPAVDYSRQLLGFHGNSGEWVIDGEDRRDLREFAGWLLGM